MRGRNTTGSHVSARKDQRRCELVGMPGFEPGASCSQSRRAAKLRHIPAASRSLPCPRRLLLSAHRVRALIPGWCPAGSTTPPCRARSGERRRYATGVATSRGPTSASLLRGRSSMAEPQPSKLVMRVRFPSPALPEPQVKPAGAGCPLHDAAARRGWCSCRSRPRKMAPRLAPEPPLAIGRRRRKASDLVRVLEVS